MLSSITDVARTRTLGGLSSDESSGAPTAAQIQAAIQMGQRLLIQAVGKDSYVTVRDFSATDLDTQANADQQDAYVTGESYFALSALPQVLKMAQFGATGMAQTTTVGTSVTTYASSQDATDAGKLWYDMAMDAIADYLIVLDAEGNPEGVTSEDGTFSFDVMESDEEITDDYDYQAASQGWNDWRSL